MDLISGVKRIENRLGKRRPDHGWGKPAQKNARRDTPGAKEDQADTTLPPDGSATRLGRKVDTTA